MQRKWLLDELAHAGRENRDPVHAAQYDAKEDAAAPAELDLLRRLGLDGDSVLIDVGAGTGQFTLAAAPHCARVYAVDVSPEMLAVLRQRLRAGGHDNVIVVQAGVLGYAHDGAPADFVYSRFALHHLPDFWKVLALQRLRRLLRPGGVLRLSDVVYHFEPDETEARLDAWCATLPERVDSGWCRADIEEHIRDEHSTFSWLLEAMMARCGLRVEEAQYSEDGIFAAYIARAV